MIWTKFHTCTTMPCIPYIIYKELWVWHVCVRACVCRTLDARYLCPTKNLQHTELKQTPIWLPRRLALGYLSPPFCPSSCASVAAQTSNHSHTHHTHKRSLSNTYSLSHTQNVRNNWPRWLSKRYTHTNKHSYTHTFLHRVCPADEYPVLEKPQQVIYVNIQVYCSQIMFICTNEPFPKSVQMNLHANLLNVQPLLYKLKKNEYVNLYIYKYYMYVWIYIFIFTCSCNRFL